MQRNIFLDDPYCRELNSTICEVKVIKKKTALALYNNIFYPGGGGQPADKGWLIVNDQQYAVHRIVKVEKKVFVVLPIRLTDSSISNQVIQKLDWQRRYYMMKYHTAAHILHSCVKKKIRGYVSKGIEIADDSSNCAIYFNGNWIPNKALINEMFAEAMKIVDNAYSIKQIYYESLDSAIKNFRNIYRGPTKLKNKVRIILIEGIDANPCGGTHLARTNELDKIICNSFNGSSIIFRLGEGNA